MSTHTTITSNEVDNVFTTTDTLITLMNIEEAVSIECMHARLCACVCLLERLNEARRDKKKRPHVISCVVVGATFVVIL